MFLSISNIFLALGNYMKGLSRILKHLLIFDSIAVLRILDVYSGSWFFTHPVSRIPDLKTSTKERGKGWKKFVVIGTLFVATISQKWKLCYFWNTEEKNLNQFSKNYRTRSVVASFKNTKTKLNFDVRSTYDTLQFFTIRNFILSPPSPKLHKQ